MDLELIKQYATVGIFIIVGILLLILLIPSGKKKGIATDRPKFMFILKGRKSTLRFYNPFVNFLVYGGANSGKTKSIGKPLLSEYIRSGFAGFIYDYKDFDLTKTAYNLTKKFNYPYNFYYINFTDLSRTHRTNIINPKVITEESLFLQMIIDFYDALNGEGKKDEWYTGALGCLKGVAIRFYTQYRDICTLPHISYFICTAGKKVLTEFIKGYDGSRILASAFIDAEDSERTQASYLSSLTNNLAQIANNKKIAYVLTGNDFEFNLLDPDNPKLLSVANSYSIEGTISPIIGLMVSASARFFNLNNKVPFFYFLDEATTSRINDFEKMPSVLREYLCSFVLLTQSASKIEKLYGTNDRASIESNFGNQFYGRTKDILSLQNYQKLFGKEDRRHISKSRGATSGGNTQSTTTSTKREEKFDLTFFQNLPSGEFIGTTSDANTLFFHDRFQMYQHEQEEPIPIVRSVLPVDIDNNFDNIKRDIYQMKY